jgi:hypothetical protein
MSKGENIVEWIKEQRISWLDHLERMKEKRMPRNIFTQELERAKRTAQERMDRRSRKRSSSAGSEKMERAGDR